MKQKNQSKKSYYIVHDTIMPLVQVKRVFFSIFQSHDSETCSNHSLLSGSWLMILEVHFRFLTF
jgi:hypothetical protein